MASGDLSAPLVSFIGRHLESVAQLEVLLLLRAAPAKWWSVDEVARAQVSAPDATALCLGHLSSHRLVAEDGASFRYEPAGPEASVVDQLAEAYATRRTTVVAQIFAPPSGGAASTLAEGFRFKRRR